MKGLEGLKNLDEQDFYKAWIEYAHSLCAPSDYCTYASLMKADADFTKQGCNPVRAYWDCPICKTPWKDCPHEAVKCMTPENPCPIHYGYAVPTWEDRPWKC